ncbi:MAG: hypothetical protein ACI9UT_001253, partial [Flavobacteriales bacterium]
MMRNTLIKIILALVCVQLVGCANLGVQPWER